MTTRREGGTREPISPRAAGNELDSVCLLGCCPDQSPRLQLLLLRLRWQPFGCNLGMPSTRLYDCCGRSQGAGHRGDGCTKSHALWHKRKPSSTAPVAFAAQGRRWRRRRQRPRHARSATRLRYEQRLPTIQAISIAQAEQLLLDMSLRPGEEAM
jgi:hypothetical protein